MLILAGSAVCGLSMLAGGLKTGVLGQARRLTDDRTLKFENVKFSPDGAKVAFTTLGYEGLYVMNADGSDCRRLSDAPGVGYMYQWSADGSELLVRDTRWEDNGDGTVRRAHAAWAVALDGRATRLSDDREDMQPASWRYGPKGRSAIALDGERLEAHATMALADEAIAAQVAMPRYRTSFITDCEHLFAVDAMGNKNLIYEGEAFMPALSPDGRRVAFVTLYDEIMVMDIDGTGKRMVAKGFSPVWANDSQIVYERTTDDGHTYTTGDLHMVNLDTLDEVHLTNGTNAIEMNPAISPDGTKIAFTDFVSGQVYIADFE